MLIRAPLFGVFKKRKRKYFAVPLGTHDYRLMSYMNKEVILWFRSVVRPMIHIHTDHAQTNDRSLAATVTKALTICFKIIVSCMIYTGEGECPMFGVLCEREHLETGGNMSGRI